MYWKLLMSYTVNIDYICIIEEDNNKVVFRKKAIPILEDQMTTLRTMIDDASVNVCDMQARFAEECPVDTLSVYNYISPYSYCSSYIPCASRPEAMSFEEYQKRLDEHEVSVRLMLSYRYEEMKEKNPQEYSRLIEEGTIREKTTFRKYLKEQYFQSVKRFLNAYAFYKVRNEELSTSTVKMVSSDTIGWSQFSYQITEDVVINIYTNFGFGQAAYFSLGLTYKGIIILPYTYLVRYYHAEMVDILKYTRLYNPVHDSWNQAFYFVEEVANMATVSTSEFVKKWIVDEIQKMLEGLRYMMNHPDEYVKDILSKAGESSDGGFITARNMSIYEREQFKAYPLELALVVRAEKIANALDIIGNLSSLAEFFPDLESVMKEIQCMAIDFLSVVQLGENALREEIILSQEELASEERHHSTLNELLQPHNEHITARFEALHVTKPNLLFSEVRAAYMEDFPEYLELVKKADDCTRKVGFLKTEITTRSSFLDLLKKFDERMAGSRQ